MEVFNNAKYMRKLLTTALLHSLLHSLTHYATNYTTYQFNNLLLTSASSNNLHSLTNSLTPSLPHSHTRASSKKHTTKTTQLKNSPPLIRVPLFLPTTYKYYQLYVSKIILLYYNQPLLVQWDGMTVATGAPMCHCATVMKRQMKVSTVTRLVR